ncbi:MAG TPA: helix-turn-helix domain-containing protein, partial [Vicinamibacterales bacterium]|nr:helix-turn-helix domain-containing protein [Vicinamibacterales bacterium]
MRSYNQYCPIAVAAEVLGDRWTLLIVRELLHGSDRFTELERGLPGISRSVLADRLDLLRRTGLIARAGRERRGRYQLTAAGRDLAPVLAALGHWGARWALAEPRPERLDPALLLWSMHRRLRFDRLPPGQTVIEFRFAGCRRDRAWLVLRPGEASVCLKHPGFEPSLVVSADAASLFRVWVNRVSLDDELRAGRIRAEGARALARSWPQWFDWPSLPRPAVRDAASG